MKEPGRIGACNGKRSGILVLDGGKRCGMYHDGMMDGQTDSSTAAYPTCSALGIPRFGPA